MGRSRVAVNPSIRRALQALPDLVEREITPELEEAGELILADMRQGLHNVTGEGAAALTYKIERQGLRLRIGLLTKKARKQGYHLRFIEFGTKGLRGEIRANGRKRRATNKADGAHFFGKFPDLPAQRARPFMQPAFDLNRGHVLQKVRGGVNRALAQARAQ